MAIIGTMLILSLGLYGCISASKDSSLSSSDTVENKAHTETSDEFNDAEKAETDFQEMKMTPELPQYKDTGYFESLISLGKENSAIVEENGDVYIWGSNEYGQLGNGSRDTSFKPQIVAGLKNIVFIAIGGFSCGAIDDQGVLYSWGRNDYGQLGNGQNEDVFNPQPIESLQDVKCVSFGETHGGAVTKEGCLYTWGDNSHGQLGDGTQNSSKIPLKVDSITDVAYISFGRETSAAVTTDGKLYVWGRNDFGYLGCGDGGDQLIPKEIILDEAVKYVSVYEDNGALVTEDGNVYTWGSNVHGQLGRGDEYQQGTFPEKLDMLSGIKYVSVGREHMGAVTENGELYMWGSNMFEQLGDQSGKDSYIPVKITRGLEMLVQMRGKIDLPPVRNISLGESHSGVLTYSGETFIWGLGSRGQIGGGTAGNQEIPQEVVSAIEKQNISLPSEGDTDDGSDDIEKTELEEKYYAENQNEAYLQALCQKLREKGGPLLENDTEYDQYMIGVCYAKLLDFNRDGNDELLLVYYTPQKDVSWIPHPDFECSGNYSFSVYSYKEGTAQRVCEVSGLMLPSMGTGNLESMKIIEYEDRLYLLCGLETSVSDHWFYYGYDREEFGIKHYYVSEYSRDDGSESYEVDGNKYYSYEEIPSEVLGWPDFDDEDCVKYAYPFDIYGEGEYLDWDIQKRDVIETLSILSEGTLTNPFFYEDEYMD